MSSVMNGTPTNRFAEVALPRPKNGTIAPTRRHPPGKTRIADKKIEALMLVQSWNFLPKPGKEG